MSSGERNRKSLNRAVHRPGLRDLDMALAAVSGAGWNARPKRVRAPYAKTKASLEVSQVGRDT